MQDRQDRPVPSGIEEFVRVPGGGQWAGLGLAVADHAGDHQVRVVEGRTVCVGEAVAQLAPLVQGAGGLRGAVAADPAGEGELPEEPQQTLFPLTPVRVDLAIGPFQPGVGEHRGRAMAGAGDEDHVEIPGTDQSVEVGPDQGLARIRSPVAEQTPLDLADLQRLAQQWVRLQVEHAGAQVQGGAPVGVQGLDLCCRQSEGRGLLCGHDDAPRIDRSRSVKQDPRHPARPDVSGTCRDRSVMCPPRSPC